jgi:hypothetical protein
VECGDLPRDLRYQGGRYRAGGQEVREHAVGRQAPHDDRPLDHTPSPVPTNPYRPLDLTPAPTGAYRVPSLDDGHDAQIDIWREAAVQRYLAPAVVGAASRRRVVEKAEVDSLLDLVDALTRQQHVGDVRLPQLDGGGARLRVGGRIAQRPDERRQRAWLAASRPAGDSA